VSPQTLSGKTILITGGTSRLGKAFVQKALAAGGRVYFTFYKNQTDADALMKAGAEGFPLDLSDSKKCEEFCAVLKTKMDHLDVLIHNAAAIADHTIQNMEEADWDKVLSVNLKAPYVLTNKLLPLLFRRKSKASESETPKVASKVFMITSRVAVIGGFGVSNYAASKAGMIGLAKSLAQELGKKQILVNAVNPGFMKSRMTESLSEEVLNRNLEASPLHLFSDPEEVAGFLVTLCSDAMTQVSGQVLHFESRKL
jgi:3-oxoacyl-[acyl-carrier protein] reductase